MLDKLNAKKEALLKEIASYEETIANRKAKLAVVEELIAEENGSTSKPEAFSNKVVTIRV